MKKCIDIGLGSQPILLGKKKVCFLSSIMVGSSFHALNILLVPSILTKQLSEDFFPFLDYSVYLCIQLWGLKDFDASVLALLWLTLCHLLVLEHF